MPEITIKVKDIIEYLQTLDPEMAVGLDHDGWLQHENKCETALEVIKNRGLFDIWKHEGKQHLTINN